VQVFGQAEQHDVAKTKSGHSDLVHQATRLFGHFFCGSSFGLDFGFIADSGQLFGQPPEAQYLWIIAEPGLAFHKIDPGSEHPRHKLLKIFDQPNAGCTMDGRNSEPHFVEVVAPEVQKFFLHGRGVEVGKYLV